MRKETRSGRESVRSVQCIYGEVYGGKALREKVF